jgi:hypothetical protein
MSTNLRFIIPILSSLKSPKEAVDKVLSYVKAGTHYNAATCNATVAATTYDVYVHQT